jgi:uncharacterized membrane protein YqaE (UPF0057 family)
MSNNSDKSNSRNRNNRRRVRNSKRNRSRQDKNDSNDSNQRIRIREDFSIGGAFKDVGKSITSAFKPLIDFFVFLFDIIIWLFEVIGWLVMDILNPNVWIEDAIMGAFVGLQIVGASLMDVCITFIREIFNRVFGPFATGIWGDEYEEKSDSKCYAAPDCSVPYPVLLATVILPPLGVFMELGLKGWLNILICAILTLVYYLPGLIYALILLYC